MRLIIEDTQDQIHDVTNMYDAKGNHTDDKEQAVSIVFKVDGGFVAVEIPCAEVIYTVH